MKNLYIVDVRTKLVDLYSLCENTVMERRLAPQSLRSIYRFKPALEILLKERCQSTLLHCTKNRHLKNLDI